MRFLIVIALLAGAFYLVANNWERLVPEKSDTCQTAERVGGGTVGSPVQVQVNCR